MKKYTIRKWKLESIRQNTEMVNRFHRASRHLYVMRLPRIQWIWPSRINRWIFSLRQFSRQQRNILTDDTQHVFIGKFNQPVITMPNSIIWHITCWCGPSISRSLWLTQLAGGFQWCSTIITSRRLCLPKRQVPGLWQCNLLCLMHKISHGLHLHTRAATATYMPAVSQRSIKKYLYSATHR